MLFAGNLLGWFVVERVRLFAVFAFLGGVAIFPFAFFVISFFGFVDDNVRWYWQQLGWVVVITVVTVVWQGLVFRFYLPAEKIKTEWQRSVLWFPFGICVVISLALMVASYYPLRGSETGFGNRPGMEWAMPTATMLLAGGGAYG